MFFGRARFSISAHQVQLVGEIIEFVGQIMTVNITLHAVSISFMEGGGAINMYTCMQIMWDQNLQNHRQSECGPILDLHGLIP